MSLEDLAKRHIDNAASMQRIRQFEKDIADLKHTYELACNQLRTEQAVKQASTEHPPLPHHSLGVNANECINDGFVGDRFLENMQKQVADKFSEILTIMGISLKDPQVSGTPQRWAKMMITEVCKGRYTPPPKLTTFPNENQGMQEMFTTGGIDLRSMCSHHFVPIVGKVWIGIIPGEQLLGLSKFNRIVEWFARRPQIQEELTAQIADFIYQELKPSYLIVRIKAEHLCMTWRGVEASSGNEMTTQAIRSDCVGPREGQRLLNTFDNLIGKS